MAQFPQFFSKISPFNLMLYFWLGTEVNASVFKSCQYKHSNDFNLFKHKGELYSALTHFSVHSHPKLDSVIAPGCYDRHATRFHCILSLLHGGVIEGQNIWEQECAQIWKKANKNQTYVHFFLLWSTKENEWSQFYSPSNESPLY